MKEERRGRGLGVGVVKEVIRVKGIDEVVADCRKGR